MGKINKPTSGINKLEGFDTDDLPSKVGGQLSLIGREDLFIDNCIEAKDRRKIETLFNMLCLHLKKQLKIQIGFKNEKSLKGLE